MQENIDERINTSLSRIKEIESALWVPELGGWNESPLPRAGEGVLEQYQAAFQQLEQLITEKGDDQRHEFVVVIPVADRPQHLKSCLDSLLQLCQTFCYGGYSENRYQRVSVIIADDSKDVENIVKHKAYADECSKQGLTTLYFGLDEQLDQMDLLSVASRTALSRVLGKTSKGAFYHKGPSIMRNITYLELNKIASVAEKVLFYFIDSDQEFRIKISTTAGDKNIYACNYFYYLDQIFTHTPATIVTGKVVGDPPVSPSVMAGNFLEDVICFLNQISNSFMQVFFTGPFLLGNTASLFHHMLIMKATTWGEVQRIIASSSEFGGLISRRSVPPSGCAKACFQAFPGVCFPPVTKPLCPQSPLPIDPY